MKRPGLLGVALSTSLAVMPTGCDDEQVSLIALETALIPPESNEEINWGSQGAIAGMCLESAGNWDECNLSDCDPEWNSKMYAWVFTIRGKVDDLCVVEFTNTVRGYEVIEGESQQPALPFVIQFDPTLKEAGVIPPENHPLGFGFFELVRKD